MPSSAPTHPAHERRGLVPPRAVSPPTGALSILLGALCLGCGTRPADEVTLGAVLSLTGSRAAWGEDLHRGITLAVEAQNARGGLLGRRVRLLALDNQGSDARSAESATRLCEREGAVALLGDVSSTAAERSAQIAQRHSIPFVAAANTMRDLTRTGDFVFRTALTDDEQVTALARYLHGPPQQRRRAAIVYRRTTVLPLNQADTFARAFRNAGGEVVLRESYSDADTELVPLATRVRGASPDVVFIPATGVDAARIALAVRSARVTAPLVGTDGWSTPELRGAAAEAIHGALVLDAFAPDAQRPEVERFVARFRERFTAEPGTFAALGFDATRWLLGVAARLPTLNARALRDGLLSSGLEDALAGPFAVDSQRRLRRSALLRRVEREGFTFSATVPAPP